MQRQITHLDSDQINKRIFDESQDANRVVIVGGVDFNFEHKDPKVITIKEPIIIRETEIREIEKPIIIKEFELKEIHIPVIVKELEIKEVERIVYKDSPKDIHYVDKIVKEFHTPKALQYLLLLQGLLIVGLLTTLFIKS